MSRDPTLFLGDILEHGRRVEERTEGMDLEAFRSDTLVYDAVLHNLAVIGEAAKNVPDDLRERSSEVPWSGIAGLRDVIAHGYFGLEDETLWEVVDEEVPLLVEQVEVLLADLEDGSG